MFKTKSSARDDYATRQAKQLELGKALETQALEAEIAALAKADELLASYEAEHAAQTEGYVFDCRRW